MSRVIEITSGWILLPACSKSRFVKLFEQQNYDVNDDGNIVWNRLNGMRYVWYLYFKGISQADMDNITRIYEASTFGAVRYYPEGDLGPSYEVYIDNPYAFQEAFKKGSGIWNGEIKLISQYLINESII